MWIMTPLVVRENGKQKKAAAKPSSIDDSVALRTLRFHPVHESCSGLNTAAREARC